eukprot:gene22138-29200_t
MMYTWLYMLLVAGMMVSSQAFRCYSTPGDGDTTTTINWQSVVLEPENETDSIICYSSNVLEQTGDYNIRAGGYNSSEASSASSVYDVSTIAGCTAFFKSLDFTNTSLRGGGRATVDSAIVLNGVSKAIIDSPNNAIIFREVVAQVSYQAPGYANTVNILGTSDTDPTAGRRLHHALHALDAASGTYLGLDQRAQSASRSGVLQAAHEAGVLKEEEGVLKTEGGAVHEAGVVNAGGGAVHESGVMKVEGGVGHAAGVLKDEGGMLKAGGGIVHEAGVMNAGGGAVHEAGVVKTDGSVGHEAGVLQEEGGMLKAGGGIVHEAGVVNAEGGAVLGAGVLKVEGCAGHLAGVLKTEGGVGHEAGGLNVEGCVGHEAGLLREEGGVMNANGDIGHEAGVLKVEGGAGHEAGGLKEDGGIGTVDGGRRRLLQGQASMVDFQVARLADTNQAALVAGRLSQSINSGDFARRLAAAGVPATSASLLSTAIGNGSPTNRPPAPSAPPNGDGLSDFTEILVIVCVTVISVCLVAAFLLRRRKSESISPTPIMASNTGVVTGYMLPAPAPAFQPPKGPDTTGYYVPPGQVNAAHAAMLAPTPSVRNGYLQPIQSNVQQGPPMRGGPLNGQTQQSIGEGRQPTQAISNASMAQGQQPMQAMSYPSMGQAPQAPSNFQSPPSMMQTPGHIQPNAGVVQPQQAPTPSYPM